jgi:hypothetical protein
MLIYHEARNDPMRLAEKFTKCAVHKSIEILHSFAGPVLDQYLKLLPANNIAR